MIRVIIYLVSINIRKPPTTKRIKDKIPSIPTENSTPMAPIIINAPPRILLFSRIPPMIPTKKNKIALLH
jgi:hypothetical protein